MASVDFSMYGNGMRFDVRGYRDTMRALKNAGAEMNEMRQMVAEVGNVVATEAKANAPRETGALAGSVRHGRGWQKAVVYIGGPNVPYAPIRHYTDRGAGHHLWATKAVNSTRATWMAVLERHLDILIAKNGL